MTTKTISAFIPLMLVLVCILSVRSVAAQEATLRIDLERALEMALANDKDAQIERFEAQRSLARLEESRANRRPDLDLRLFYRRNNQVDEETTAAMTQPNQDSNAYGARLNLDTKLLTWSRNNLLVSVAELRAQAVVPSIAVLYSTAALYYEVLLREKILETATVQRDVTDMQVRSSRHLFDAGKTSRFDVLRVQVDAVNSQIKVLKQRNALNKSLRDLRQTLHIEPHVEIELTDRPVYQPRPLTHEQLVAIAFKNRPDLKRLTIEQQIEEREIALEREGPEGNLSLFLGYEAQDNVGSTAGTADFLTAGISLSYPLARYGVTDSRVEQARLALLKSQVHRSAIESSIRRILDHLLTDKDEAEDILDAQQPNIELARESLRISQISYNNGTATTVDVNAAREALERAQTEFYEALFDHTLTLIRIAEAIGVEPTEVIKGRNLDAS